MVYTSERMIEVSFTDEVDMMYLETKENEQYCIVDVVGILYLMMHEG